MKQAAIISIGTEIMKGHIDDTNSTFLSRFLYQHGIKVKYRMNVDDNIDRIVSALGLTKDCDLFILTGGLGPTTDDCTRLAFAQYLGQKLVFDKRMWHDIQQLFKKHRWKIPNSNKNQAMIIKGGRFIPNRRGTAPGIYCQDKNKLYFLLPGPPQENQPMVTEYLPDILDRQDFIQEKIHTEIIRIYNRGESEIAELLQSLHAGCQLGFYFTQTGWIGLHVSHPSDISLVQKTMTQIKKILSGQDIFYTEDKDLNLLVLEQLKQNNRSIAFAESISGGGLSAELVKQTGASQVFKGGIVAYSNQVKINLLGVKQQTLNKYGAVSKNVVKEMVQGLKQQINANINVAISGIAGPEGGTGKKPVGLVCFAFMFDHEIIIDKQLFFGNRLRIINRCINYVYSRIIKRLILDSKK